MKALATLANIVVAPSAAFASLRERPTWVVAFVVTSLGCLLAQMIMLPATLHAFAAWYPSQLAHDPRTAAMTPAERQAAVSLSLGFVRIGSVLAALSPVVAALCTALVLWAASALSHRNAGFLRLFALAMNVAVVWFVIGQLTNAVIVAARGQDAFTAPWQINLAVPSLGWLGPATPSKLLGFMIGLNPFSLWSLLLLGAGTTAIARVPRLVGYAAAAVITLFSCLVFAFAVQP